MNDQVAIRDTTRQVADPMLAMIERVIMDPAIPVDRITSLMDIRERQMNKEAEQAFNAAFASAMAEMPDVPRSGLNKHTGQKYPTLDDLVKTARPVLSAHGLTLSWEVEDGDQIRVTAVVRHALGHQITTSRKGQRDSGKAMNALQGAGSTQTYLQRYTGFAILGLTSGEADDDGAKGGGNTITEEQFLELRGLLDRSGVAEQVLIDAYKVPALDVLSVADFTKARKRLLATIKAKDAA